MPKPEKQLPADGKTRCFWCLNGNPLMVRYHDEEWGVPMHDDQGHFEFLVLDAFQAGLSWNTIINKREGFRKAFSNFDVKKVSRYGDKEIGDLLQDTGIIRNSQKITATIKNAQAFMELQAKHGSFDKYIWQFTDYKTIHNKWTERGGIPASTSESDKMSKALKKLGFGFVGTTICYAYMQAAGMVNDHLLDCHRYKNLV